MTPTGHFPRWENYTVSMTSCSSIAINFEMKQMDLLINAEELIALLFQDWEWQKSQQWIEEGEGKVGEIVDAKL